MPYVLPTLAESRCGREINAAVASFITEFVPLCSSRRRVEANHCATLIAFLGPCRRRGANYCPSEISRRRVWR